MSYHPLVPDFILEQDATGRSKGSLVGAVQFVDISGFTALTEVLMKHGKEGAEALGEALRFHFDPLVDAVEEAGGFITGFAGDAFTAIYPKEETREVAEYALHTSRQIQDFFAKHETFETPYGSFGFGVKIGLSWGVIEWEILDSPAEGAFTAADPPTYYFCGPGVDGSAASESYASKGQTVMDPAFAERVPILDLEQINDGYFRDHGSLEAQPFEPLPLVPKAEIQIANRFVPPELESFPRTGEFRRVAIVFISFENIPSLAQFAHQIQRSLRRYGGTFTRFDFGDKGGNCLVFFGVPTAHENNEERALDFAKEMLALHQGGPPDEGQPQLRAGVTQNIMYAGFNGGAQRHEFACLGRAVSMAARLMMKADWGQIWCDPRVYKRCHTLFSFEPLEKWFLKGFAEPIPLYALQQRKQESQAQFSAVSLIGREGELKTLLKGTEIARQRSFAGIYYVDGEAGMGKSYLVACCRQQVKTLDPQRDGLCLDWIYAPTNQTLQGSLHPFIYALRMWAGQSTQASAAENLDAFESALEELQRELPASRIELQEELERLSSFLAALLGHLIPGSLYEELEPRFRFTNTLSAISRWLEAHCVLQPVVLQIEDAHWLDDASIQALKLLLQDAQDWPLMVLCTCRYLDDGSPFRLELSPEIPSTEINLNQLSRSGLESLAESHLGDAAHPSLLDLLEEKARGNPFFVEQILSFLQDQDALMPTELGLAPTETGEILPEEATSILIARLDRLTPPVKHVVQVASSLGREFEWDILAAMLHGLASSEDSGTTSEQLSLASPKSWVEKAEMAQIWSSTGATSYMFLHALMRDAAYDMQARARLRHLHSQAGQAFEEIYHADLHPHFGELAYHFERAGLGDKAAYYLEKAGDEARQAYRNQEALDYYQRLLRYLPDTGEATRKAHLSTAQVMQVLHRIEEGLEACDKAEAAQPQPSAQVCYQRAFLTQMKGEFDAARQLIEEAFALAQQQSDHEWEARCLNSLGVLRLYRGAIDEASQYFEQSLQIATDAGLPEIQAKAISNMAGVAMARKELDATLAYLEQSLALARELKDRWTEYLSLGNMGELYLQMERADMALVRLEEAIATGKEIGTRNANFLANYGESLRRLSRLDEARFALEEAEELARSTGNAKHIIDALYAQSRLAQTLGHPQRAKEALHEALELAQGSNQKTLEEKIQKALDLLEQAP